MALQLSGREIVHCSAHVTDFVSLHFVGKSIIFSKSRSLHPDLDMTYHYLRLSLAIAYKKQLSKFPQQQTDS